MRPMSYLQGLLLLLLILPAPVIIAEQESVRPGINEYYKNPDFDVWVSRFESEGREVFDQRKAIVKALALKPGMQIADIGAGTGLFTKEFAREVGFDGKVYAVDISKGFISNIERISKQLGLANITTIVNTPKSSGLSANSIDLAFTCDTYHHFEYPNAMLQSIYHALKKNGQLVVIDYRKQQGISSAWVMGHVRANQQTVVSEIEANGFKVEKTIELLTENYFLVFTKQ